MKKVLLYLMLWLATLVVNGCVYERHRDVNVYPKDYGEWSEERRRDWREHHPEFHEQGEERHEDRHEDRH